MDKLSILTFACGFFAGIVFTIATLALFAFRRKGGKD